MKKRAPVEYVNNKEFYEAILVYRAKVKEAEERGLEPPRLPNYIGACIQKIAEKLSLKPCFMNYSFRDEMISDGIENCLLYFHDYNPEITQNPFAYFTQIVYYAFLRRITKEEKNRYAIYKNFQESILEHNLLVDSDDNNLMPSQLYDNINDFMDKFEKKEAVKKEKRKHIKGITRFLEEEKNE